MKKDGFGTAQAPSDLPGTIKFPAKIGNSYYTIFSVDYYVDNYICDINNRLYVIIVT